MLLFYFHSALGTFIMPDDYAQYTYIGGEYMTEESEHSDGQDGEFEIVIDRVEYDLDTATPVAGTLMELAGTDGEALDQYQLIALDGPSDEGGQRDTVFHHDDEIDLRKPNRRHFRNVPKGNPRS